MENKQVPKFKVGDVVSLRSQRMNMVVEFVLGYDKKVHPAVAYICVWMNKDGNLNRDEISESALIRSE